MDLLSILNEFNIFVPNQLQEQEKNLAEIEIIIEQGLMDEHEEDDETLPGDIPQFRMNIDLELEEGKADLVLGSSLQPVLQNCPSGLKVYQNNIKKSKQEWNVLPAIRSSISSSSVKSHSQLEADVFNSAGTSSSSAPSRTWTIFQPDPSDEWTDLHIPNEASVTLPFPKNFYDASVSSLHWDLEKNQLKRATANPSSVSSFCTLPSYHAQTWCFGVFSSEPERPFEVLQYDDPLAKSKLQPFVHDWTSFKQPTFLPSRPKRVYVRSEAGMAKRKASSSHQNKAVLKLADIHSMKTHRGKIHVTLNGQPLIQSSLPHIFNDASVNHDARLWSSMSDSIDVRGPGRRSTSQTLVSDESDKIDLALAKHFLQEQVRTKQRLQLRAKMFSERLVR